ncbi:cytochrome c [Thalassomonas sp. RHCl1]|uniref:c-type cytochrome n=1 Tax=Thalassomonas sp. RHCl1 TaxID=2995320 RepID=UPI00248BB97C|nr:cytochrome c [Thalassomonas sp. RHCl1]
MFFKGKNFSAKLPLALLFTGAFSGKLTAGETPLLGKALTVNEIKSISTTVFPDGKGLPHGSGTAADGEKIYAQQCAACHAQDGSGGVGPKLVSKPEKGPYWSTGGAWPYATSIFDYVRRAMPPANVKQLSSDEVYALTAYLLYLNGLVEHNQVLNNETLALIKMPARDYVSSKWQKEEKALFKKELKKR